MVHLRLGDRLRLGSPPRLEDLPHRLEILLPGFRDKTYSGKGVLRRGGKDDGLSPERHIQAEIAHPGQSRVGSLHQGKRVHVGGSGNDQDVFNIFGHLRSHIPDPGLRLLPDLVRVGADDKGEAGSFPEESYDLGYPFLLASEDRRPAQRGTVPHDVRPQKDLLPGTTKELLYPGWKRILLPASLDLVKIVQPFFGGHPTPFTEPHIISCIPFLVGSPLPEHSLPTADIVFQRRTVEVPDVVPGAHCPPLDKKRVHPFSVARLPNRDGKSDQAARADDSHGG